jgi:hypothetical protein
VLESGVRKETGVESGVDKETRCQVPMDLGLRSEFRSLLCSPERTEWLYSSSVGKKKN